MNPLSTFTFAVSMCPEVSREKEPKGFGYLVNKPPKASRSPMYLHM